MNIPRFNDRMTLTPVLTDAGVVATADQATAAKDLFGVAVMARVTDSGGQPGHLEVAETLKLGPNPVRGLSDPIN